MIITDNSSIFMGKKLLILGGSEFQIPLVKTAKSYGLIVGLVDIDESNPCRNYSDFYYKCSIKEKEKVEEIAQKFNPDGITTGITDSAVQTCAYVAKKMMLPGISEKVALNATNKYEMIKRFQEKCVPCPTYALVTRNSKKSPLGYPAIIKPMNMAGSRGIFKVNTDEELIKAIDTALKISGEESLLIEEYMDGPEVSVELAVIEKTVHIVQITDKTTTGAPHFIETGHFQPSQLPDDAKEKIKKVAIKAAEALEFENCLGHAEIKLTKNGPKMVEIGARAGGDGIGEQLIKLTTGVDFQEICIKLALGLKINLPALNEKKCAYIKFFQSNKGKLKTINGLDKLPKSENINAIKITATIGGDVTYQDPKDNGGRFGYIICTGKTYKETKELMDATFDEIKIIMQTDKSDY